MQFLRGLNDQYSNIRSHVLLMEPIPPISKIFSLIAQQERQLANHISISISSINSVDSTRTSSSTLCTFCGKHVHTENVCFRKVGFPNQDNMNSKSNTRKVCTYCNRNGHTVDTCYKKHGYPPGYKSYNSNRTNQINSLITTDGVFSEPCLKEQEKRDYQLTAHQIQIINDVLRQNNNDTPPNPIQVNQVDSFSADPNAHELSSMGNSWIVDSGATDHVCTVLSAFTSYKTIKPVLINLPNGQHVFANYSGTVVFTNKLYLLDVLYIPQFTCNLISASKLSLHLKCNLIFSPPHCLIQDNLSKEHIGLANAKAGLYIFNSSIFTLPHTTLFLLSHALLRKIICGIIEWDIPLMKGCMS
ncbi:uncharacterized protein [Phaseolus vulgaris]|uniref:uncharacterized protein n=1 Tax=Phaseolus vulgaris TaxID=3885 RepID=UPI0035CA7B73